MTTTVDQTAFLEKLRQWSETAAQLKALTEKERTLRQEVFNTAFSSPKKGTNNAKLPHGWVLKGTYVINIKVDDAAVPAMRQQLADAKIDPDSVFKMKPELSMKGFNALEKPVQDMVNTVLTYTPGLPSLELVPPKDKEKKGTTA